MKKQDYIDKILCRFDTKKIKIFGVEMTRYEEMKFSKFRNNGNTPAFNTLNDVQRTEITTEWIRNERLKTE